MTGHKFKIGQKVQLLPDPLNRKPGIYEIKALLPEEQQGWQYRIEDPKSHRQRVTYESKLADLG